MDSTQLKEKVGVLDELRQKNGLIDELSSALEKEKQTTEGKRDTVNADSKLSAGDMDDTMELTQLEDELTDCKSTYGAAMRQAQTAKSSAETQCKSSAETQFT